MLLLAWATVLAVVFPELACDAKAFDEFIPTTIGLVSFGGSPLVGKGYKLSSRAPSSSLFALPTLSPTMTGGTLTVTVGEGTSAAR